MIDFHIFQVSIPLLWVAAGIIIAGTELLFPTEVSIWPGISAVLVGLMIKIGLIGAYSFQWQFFWFAVLTAILICLWFLIIKRYTNIGSSTVDKYRDSSLANIKGTVIEKIESSKPGMVELHNSYHGIKKWKAESKENIEIGTEITVEDADGIRLIVKKSE